MAKLEPISVQYKSAVDRRPLHYTGNSIGQNLNMVFVQTLFSGLAAFASLAWLHVALLFLRFDFKLFIFVRRLYSFSYYSFYSYCTLRFITLTVASHICYSYQYLSIRLGSDAGIDDCWQLCNSGPGGKGNIFFNTYSKRDRKFLGVTQFLVFNDANGYPIVNTKLFPDMKGFIEIFCFFI